MDADGKQVSLYATTCEELYEKELEAHLLQEIQHSLVPSCPWINLQIRPWAPQDATAAEEGHSNTIHDALIRVAKFLDSNDNLSRLEQELIRQFCSDRRQGVLGPSPQPAAHKLAILDIHWISRIGILSSSIPVFPYLKPITHTGVGPTQFQSQHGYPWGIGRTILCLADLTILRVSLRAV